MLLDLFNTAIMYEHLHNCIQNSNNNENYYQLCDNINRCCGLR